MKLQSLGTVVSSNALHIGEMFAFADEVAFVKSLGSSLALVRYAPGIGFWFDHIPGLPNQVYSYGTDWTLELGASTNNNLTGGKGPALHLFGSEPIVSCGRGPAPYFSLATMNDVTPTGPGFFSGIPGIHAWRVWRSAADRTDPRSVPVIQNGAWPDAWLRT